MVRHRFVHRHASARLLLSRGVAAAALVVVATACGSGGDEPDAAPTTIVDDAAQAGADDTTPATEPDATEPDATEPDTTEPDTTEPDVEPEAAGGEGVSDDDADAEAGGGDAEAGGGDAEPTSLRELVPTGGGLMYSVQPGMYRTDRLGVDVDFEIVEPVQIVNRTGQLSIAPTRASQQRVYGTFIVPVNGVIDPPDGAQPSNDITDDLIQPLTGPFAEWLDADPRFSITDTGTVEALGGEAPWWDTEVVADDAATYGCRLIACFAALAHPNSAPTPFSTSYRYRFIVLDGLLDPQAGATLVAIVHAPEDEWDEVLAAGESLIRSLTLAEN